MVANNTRKRIIGFDASKLTQKQLEGVLSDEKKVREKVRAKLASGETIIIPKEISDAFKELEKAS